MSVLIKGMEMPKNCRVCPIVSICPSPRAAPGLYLCICRLDYSEHDFNTREHCPLIHVPPHGRLGDLDAIMTKLNETSKRVFGNDSVPECSSLSIVADYIEAAPTIIPADKEADDD